MRSSQFFFFVVTWSLQGFIIPSFCKETSDSSQSEDDVDVDVESLEEDNRDILRVLGKEDMFTMKSSWALTVNEQCLYEFVYQFEHNSNLPMGEDSFKGVCDFGNLDNPAPPQNASDGLPYLQPRRFYERFPPYVATTMGFNHLSVDWLPCGRKPAGYKTPQYDLSFFRVTPEYRATSMTCKVTETDTMTVVPGQEFCDTEQNEPNGMNFFIVPAALSFRDPVVNMPAAFSNNYLSDGPIPHIGLRAWDDDKVPEKPDEWNDVPIFMSSHAGKLVMWQAHIPYKMIQGPSRQFHSNADRYYETTMQTLPDTWSVKYDERDGKIYFTMVGKAEICRGEYERAQKAAGGPPIFPDYELLIEKGYNGTNYGENGDGKGRGSSGSSRGVSHTIVSTTILQFAMLIFVLIR